MIAAIPTPSVDWFALSPELVLLGGSLLALLAAVLGRRPVLRRFARVTRRFVPGSFCLQQPEHPLIILSLW